MCDSLDKTDDVLKSTTGQGKSVELCDHVGNPLFRLQVQAPA